MGKDYNTITALWEPITGRDEIQFLSWADEPYWPHKMNSLTLLLDLNNIFFRKWIKILNDYSMHMYVSLQELCVVCR